MKTATSVFYLCAKCDKRPPPERKASDGRAKKRAAESSPGDQGVANKAADERSGGAEGRVEQGEGPKQPLKKVATPPRPTASAKARKAPASAVAPLNPGGTALQHNASWIFRSPYALQPASFASTGWTQFGNQVPSPHAPAPGVAGSRQVPLCQTSPGRPETAPPAPASRGAGMGADSGAAGGAGDWPTAVAVQVEEDGAAAGAGLPTVHVALLPPSASGAVAAHGPQAAAVDCGTSREGGFAGAGAAATAGGPWGVAQSSGSGTITLANARQMAELAAFFAAQLTWTAVRPPGTTDVLPQVLAAGCSSAALRAFNFFAGLPTAPTQYPASMAATAGSARHVAAGSGGSAPGFSRAAAAVQSVPAAVAAASASELIEGRGNAATCGDAGGVKEEAQSSSQPVTKRLRHAGTGGIEGGEKAGTTAAKAGTKAATLAAQVTEMQCHSSAFCTGAGRGVEAAAAAASSASPARKGRGDAAADCVEKRNKVEAAAAAPQAGGSGRHTVAGFVEDAEQVSRVAVSSVPQVTVGQKHVGSGGATTLLDGRIVAAVAAASLQLATQGLKHGAAICVEKANNLAASAPTMLEVPCQSQIKHRSNAFANGAFGQGRERPSVNSSAGASASTDESKPACSQVSGRVATEEQGTSGDGDLLLDGSEHVGQYLAKEFGGRPFLGKVVAWAAPTAAGEAALWRVVYHDGDEEDLDDAELRECFAFHRRTAPNRLAQHRAAVDAHVADWRLKRQL